MEPADPQSAFDPLQCIGQKLGEFVLGPIVSDRPLPVFEGHHARFGGPFVVTLCPLSNGTGASLLWNEACIAMRLDHPNIAGATMASVGRIEPAGFDVIWAAAAELPEQSLDQLARQQGGSLAPQMAVHVATQLLTGLAHAHRSGVVHGGISPAGVRVSPDGTVRLGGFGMTGSWSTDRDRVPNRQTEFQPWEMEFRAPEQWESPARVDERTDLFAVGVEMWTMIAGRRPFGSGDEATMRARICEYDPPELSRVTGVDPALSGIVSRLMARAPHARFASAQDTLEALARWSARMSHAALPTMEATIEAATAVTAPSASQRVSDGLSADPARAVRHLATVLPWDPAFMDGLRITLASVNLAAVELKDTRALLETLHTRPIHAILFDPDMDSTGNGFQAVAAIRREWASIPIVIYSSRTEPHDRLRGLMSGADRYMAQPRSPLRIVAEFCHLLGIDPLQIQLAMAADTVVYDAALLEQSFGQYIRDAVDDR